MMKVTVFGTKQLIVDRLKQAQIDISSRVFSHLTAALHQGLGQRLSPLLNQVHRDVGNSAHSLVHGHLRRTRTVHVS